MSDIPAEAMKAATKTKSAQAEPFAQTPRPAKRKLAGSTDPMVVARLTYAAKAVERSGALQGRRTRRLSARVDPGLLEAAKAKSGIQNDSDLINAALAAIAEPDNFGAWLVAQAGTLPPDFGIDF
jgi:hypothetical protein